MSRDFETVPGCTLAFLDPLTLLHCSSVCKQINNRIVNSSSLQLRPRKYLYQIQDNEEDDHNSTINAEERLKKLIQTQYKISNLRAKHTTFNLPNNGIIMLAAARGYIVTRQGSAPQAGHEKWELCKIWSDNGRNSKAIYVPFKPFMYTDTPISIEYDVIMPREEDANGNATKLHILHLFNNGQWATPYEVGSLTFPG
ncbi:uncharacterized protein L201_005308 [Kwoniella dendrophila CBS 6074]|uniref:F-box domain-containing protein n=1 Tax=Kwoniella dendrophila CBS 6074 TaxID=1295534 RepID=A0AAX4K0K5_9TREE